MGQISGVGGSPYSMPSQLSPQQEEIRYAIIVYTEAINELANNAGRMSPQTLEECKKSLQAIENDPKMPQPVRDKAAVLLNHLEHAGYNEITLPGILTELWTMHASPTS